MKAIATPTVTTAARNRRPWDGDALIGCVPPPPPRRGARVFADHDDCWQRVATGSKVINLSRVREGPSSLVQINGPSNAEHANSNGAIVYTKIIVPFDGTEFSARSITVARQLAIATAAPIKIVAFGITQSQSTTSTT
jgi:hypothetical protein